MANMMHEAGRNAFLTGSVNWVNGKGGAGAIQAALIGLTATTGIKAISGTTTGAGAAAVTCTSHGFANGDVVIITGVGGTLTANQVWVVGGQTTNAFNLLDYNTGVQGTLTGAYTSGGFAINMGPSIATYAGYSAALVGGAAGVVAVPGATEAQGIAGASATTFTAISGVQVAGVMLFATASAVSGTIVAADIPVAWIDCSMIVTCAAALAAGTVLPVERIAGPIANGTVLSFSDGTSATLTAQGVQYARTLTVSSTTVAAAARASAPALGGGLPVTPNGGNISITWDTVVLPGTGQHVGVFKL